MPFPFKHILSIVAVCSLTLFWNLGSSKLWDRDEPRNAGCAAEMLEANNWVVPIFNDELRPQKPVLLYWLIISAYKIFGQNEFSARFWSALLGVGSCLLTYAIGRRMFDATIGWLSAIILATSLMFCVAARAATPDSLLIFCCTLAYWFYIRGVFENKRIVDGAFPRKVRQWIPFYWALGLAVLAKGPIGFLIPMAVVGMFMLIQRRHGSLPTTFAKKLKHFVSYFAPIHFLKTLQAMRFIAGTLLMLLVAFPWHYEVDTQTHGLFTRLFFLNENFARATTTMENHAGGFWYYPLAILVGFFPWSVFAGPTIAFLSTRPANASKQQSAITFLIGWVAIQVITFSLFSTKLPSYVTPCYPALAILTAFSLVEFTKAQAVSNRRVRWHVAAMIALIASGIAFCVGMWIGFEKYLPGVRWIVLSTLIPIVGGAFGYWLLCQSKHRQAVAATAVTATLFCWTLFGFGTVAVSKQQHTDRIFSHIAQHSSQVVGTWKCMEPSWVVYGQKSIYELNQLGDFGNLNPSDVERRITRIGNKAPWEFKQRPTVHDFLVKFPDALMLTTDEHLDSLKSQLSVGETTTGNRFEVVEQADLFLKPGRKLLLLAPISKQ